MKKIILSTLAFGAMLLTSSCDEDHLEIEQKGVTAYENFYQSDADADAALANMYASFIHNVGGTEGIDNPEQVMLNYSADDILAAGGNPQDHDGFRVFCEFTHDNANGTLKSAYQRYYFANYAANLVICNFTNEDGEEPKFTSSKTAQYVEEARVMRAYLHLMLALSWQRPPIIDHLITVSENPNQPESQEEVLKWVIEQCEKAISSGKLPKRNGPTDKDATARMSVGFAQFVAGKAAMFMNDNATARKYLSALIDSKNYELIASEEYWTNFHVAGDGNSEKIFEPNYIDNENFGSWGIGQPIFRGRWMVAQVFCWRTKNLASSPLVHDGFTGWNGGAVQMNFAKKFVEHDGDSPRRRACFLTADEWLYEMDWVGSEVNDGSLADKKKDPKRGISASEGVFSHGPYFEWKHMTYINPPKILTGGKEYPSDHSPKLGYVSNQKNFNVARYAEALLLYAEACIGSSDEAKGLAALQAIQTRSGSGKISTALTLENVMEEKQYEMWFESCRFHDLVRWSKLGKVDLDKVFNQSGIHTQIPYVYDAFFTPENGSTPESEHRLYVKYTDVKKDCKFVVGKNEYFPFPRDYTVANPNLHQLGGWATE